MQAKEFMESVRRAERELKIISAKRRHYEDLIQSIGSNMGAAVISKPTGVSKTETAALGIIEMTELLAAQEKEFAAKVQEAEKLIAKLRQPKFRQILTLRYLCDWSWKSISDELDYSDEKSVFRCHKFALKELQKVM